MQMTPGIPDKWVLFEAVPLMYCQKCDKFTWFFENNNLVNNVVLIKFAEYFGSVEFGQ